jgi:hypothetical protein
MNILLVIKPLILGFVLHHSLQDLSQLQDLHSSLLCKLCAEHALWVLNVFSLHSHLQILVFDPDQLLQLDDLLIVNPALFPELVVLFLQTHVQRIHLHELLILNLELSLLNLLILFCLLSGFSVCKRLDKLSVLIKSQHDAIVRTVVLVGILHVL